jgi:bifunctional ADP-heptose synthase (sugar kinase/adenylyltransferase)
LLASLPKLRMDTRTKIVPADRVASELAAIAKNGKVVVAAAGWFDVLQAAHGERLSAAKPVGARLVVFVYDDGPERRGLLDAASRAQMVAALAAVDCVVICPDAEAASLAVRSNLPPPLLIEDAMPRDIVADVLRKQQAE